MTNERAGEGPQVEVHAADGGTPFDVSSSGTESAEAYTIEVASDPAEAAAIAAAATELGLDDDPEDEPAPVKKKPFQFQLPEPGPLLQVPAYFPRAMIPKDIVFPRGIEVLFIKIPRKYTAAQHRGDRFLIVWGSSEADEKLSIGRAMGDNNRGVAELTKQVIRAVDGHIADWSGMPTPGSIDQIWREIGPKGRNLMIRLMTKINTLDEAELTYFFEACIAVVPTG